MEFSGKTVYDPVLKTTQLSARAQNHASPERCHKSFTIIFLGCKNQQKTSSYRRNIVPYKEIGIKESNGDVRTLTGSS